MLESISGEKEVKLSRPIKRIIKGYSRLTKRGSRIGNTTHDLSNITCVQQCQAIQKAVANTDCLG